MLIVNHKSSVDASGLTVILRNNLAQMTPLEEKVMYLMCGQTFGFTSETHCNTIMFKVLHSLLEEITLMIHYSERMTL